VNKQGTVANITLPIAGSGTDAASNAFTCCAGRSSPRPSAPSRTPRPASPGGRLRGETQATS
jgi:hypothetical protein